VSIQDKKRRLRRFFMDRKWILGIVPALLLVSCATISRVEPKLDLVAQVLKTACRIEWYNENGDKISGGSGTCIWKQGEADGKVSAYILTAAHVTEKPQYTVKVTKINISLDSLPTITTEEKVGEPIMKIIAWEYDKNGRSGKVHTYQAKEVWRSNRVDASIVKTTAPYIALNVAKVMRISDFESLQVGDRVIRTGCPFLGPPFLTRGFLSRFSVGNYDWFNLDTTHGDSGAGLFAEDTMKLMAVTAVRRPGVCYMCGATPLDDVFKELLETDLKFLVPIG
jgi:hypothetical protein